MGVTFNAAFPTVYVEIGLSTASSGFAMWDVSTFDSGTFGPDTVWTDITADIRQLTTNLGRQREGDRYYGGMSLVADNRTGKYTPGNLAGPFVSAGISQIRPRVPIRVRTVWNGTAYAVAYGFVSDWGDRFPQYGFDALTQITVVDAWWKIASVNPFGSSAVGQGETAGQRVQRIASAAGWTLPTNVQQGTATMQATTLAQSLSSEMLLTADSEGGEVWCDPDGTLVFEGRYSLVESVRSNTARVTFGPGAGEIPMSDIQMSQAADRLANQFLLARAGGTQQTAADPTSVALYGAIPYTRHDLICESDATVVGIAGISLAIRKDPEYRPASVMVQAAVNPSLMWPWALGLRIRDRVNIKVNSTVSGVTTTHHCFVEGVQHDISPQQWATTFTFSSATPYDGFTTSTWDTGLFETAQWFF